MIPTRGHRPSVNRAAQKVEDVQSALTYLPRTEAGQEYLEKTAGALGVLGMPAEFLGEQTLKLTGSPFLATTANVALDPVNYIGIPGTGKATVAAIKATGRGAMQAGRAMAQDPAVGAAVERAIQRVAPAAMPMYAVKPKGGNWLAGEVEEATEPLKRPAVPQELTDEFGASAGVTGQEALNNWIDKKLNRYIRNEMATPEDPVRKLAEQGILHFNPQADAFLRSEARDRRTGEGNQLGVTPLAKAWEDNSDLFIIPSRAEDFQSYSPLGGVKSNNPWLDKVPPETKVYEAASTGIDNLGFEHLIDELKNSIRPDSDLPAHLRWKPEDLEKVTMEQAVKRVHDINQYRAQKKAEANEVLARNPATATFKEYPTIPGTDKPNEKGLAWKEIKPPEMSVELPQGWSEPVQKGNALQSKSVDGGIALGADLPDLIKNIYKRHPETPGNPRKALEEALKYEGDVMGHCVGGYCDDVLSGRTKIYSLRDNKGEPLVTIEVQPKTRSLTNRTDWFTSQPEDVQNRITTEALALEKSLGTGLELGSRENWQKAFASVIDKNMGEELPVIEQIKGSGKKDSSQRLRIKETGYKDEPDAYLLPFIQDFVRSGNWSFVNDIQNTGLITPNKILSSETRKRLEAQGVQIPKYMTEQEAKELSKQAIRASDIPTLDQSAGGMKRGGSVRISDNPDTMQLELQVGGAVKAAKAASKAAAKAAEKEGLSVPFDIPRAPAKSKEEIRPIAERMARQMTGEFVRLDPKESINPAGKSLKRFLQEKEFEKDYITRPTKQVTEPEFADIEKQLGMVKFGIPGDTTIANQELIQAGPYMLDIPSPQHGGPRFPLGGEGAWASNNPQAANVQKRAGEMSEYFNAPVMGQYIAMGPTGSNFAQHFADASLRAIDLSKMSKSQIEQFNELIRKGSEDSGPRPSFPGIQDKDQAYFWLSWDPELRKHFNALMVKPKYTQPFGLPDGRVILDAITEPALRNKEISTSGFSQFDLDPSIRPEDIPLSEHPTYTHLIPMKKGAPVRQTRYPIPAELEFPDVTKFIRERYRPSEFTPTFQKASPRQKIDQQAIDEIKMYEEMMKSLTGKKKGGAVKKQAGGAIKAAVKAAKPTAEQAAKMAEQRAELVLRSRAMQELKDQFENLPQPPKGFLSSESILQRMDEIRRREATPSGEQIPLLKKGGKVKFTDNLDTMRLAVQKRK